MDFVGYHVSSNIHTCTTLYCTCMYIYVHVTIVCLPPFTVPNSGVTLWFQQFYAMFLKKFYNSLRFWQAAITQLILPLLFILLGLVLVKTLPNDNENDPPRAMNVQNSAIDADNRIFFYAVFGDDVFDFEVR